MIVFPTQPLTRFRDGLSIALALAGLGLGGCALTKKPMVTESSRTQDIPSPVSARAARFLREDYHTLVERYGRAVPPLDGSLLHWILESPPEMWQRLEHRRVKFFRGVAAVRVGGINIVMPPGWHATAENRRGNFARYWVQAVPRENSFRMLVAAPATPCLGKTKAAGAKSAPDQGHVQNHAAAVTKPSILRVERWANSTPMDFVLLIGSKSGQPQKRRNRLVWELWRRLDHKQYALGYATDCVSNGRMHAFIGAESHHGRELANILLFAPDGAFCGRLNLRFAGPLKHAATQSLCEELVRGAFCCGRAPAPGRSR